MAKLLTFVETDVFRKRLDSLASIETLFAKSEKAKLSSADKKELSELVAQIKRNCRI